MREGRRRHRGPPPARRAPAAPPQSTGAILDRRDPAPSGADPPWFPFEAADAAAAEVEDRNCGGTRTCVACSNANAMLGAQPRTPEWGAMLTDSRDYLKEAWWDPTFPGLALAVTVFGFNLLGDALRDWLDPRLRR